MRSAHTLYRAYGEDEHHAGRSAATFACVFALAFSYGLSWIVYDQFKQAIPHLDTTIEVTS